VQYERSVNVDERDLLDKLKAIQAKRAEFGRHREPRLHRHREVLDLRNRHRRPSDADVQLQQLPRPHLRPDGDGCRAKRSCNGTGTTGSRTANTLSLHEDLERDFAGWFGKRHALIFSTGCQANLSVIGGLCGPDDTILIDSDSHASIYDATRQAPSQVVAFRHNSPESLRKKLERLPKNQRNRLVVAEGLYSIRGDVAPLRELVAVAREYGAYVMVDEAFARHPV
jgi:7-keto-8-aminopelargonate synthetase-like enzyme